MRLRPVFFWAHLAVGVVSGLIIALLSFTGAVLAFDYEIKAWAERSVRQVESVPANTPALPMDELLARFRAEQPELRLTAVTVRRDPQAAVVLAAGRESFYANPYTGELRQPESTRTRDFLDLMLSLHRWLALSDEKRATGRTVTGAANLAFVGICLTGLVIWWPRRWNWRSLRAILWFTKARGKARDWNWHHVLGFWSFPVLLVLSVSGVVISYRWANDLVYRMAGETPQAGGPPQVGEVSIEPRASGRPIGFQAALESIQAAHPDWSEITVREGLPRRRGAPSPAPAAAAGADAGRPRSPQPYSATLREQNAWPAFATTALVLHPHDGTILQRSGYDDMTPGRKARTWLRYLHTGAALGWPGQLIAGLASLGAVVLAWTGLALTWRRFFHKRSRGDAAPSAAH